jgi:hypothetical protein
MCALWFLGCIFHPDFVCCFPAQGQLTINLPSYFYFNSICYQPHPVIEIAGVVDSTNLINIVEI